MRFCPDVTDYKKFYATALGRQVRHAITRRIESFWPDLAGDTLIGLGYSVPYLKPYLRQKNGEIISFMMAEQGAVYWPRNRENLCSLVDAEHLPLRDAQINRVLVAHALEYSEYPLEVLQEIWRVLTPGGRAILMVPNRKSWWSHSEKSVFSHGYPYRIGQLRNLVDEVGFTEVQTAGALYFPPLEWKLLYRMMPLLEYASNLLRAHLGGVIIMHVEKQLYASAKEAKKPALLKGVYAPSGKPALSKNP